MRHEACAIVLFLAAALGPAGCASPKVAEEIPREEPPPAREPAPREPPVQVGRYLVYQLQWLRAEEAMETLLPIFESRYGPGIRIVPHIPTNKLIIYVPSRREQEMMQGGGGGGAPVPQTGQGMGQQRVPQTGQAPISRSRLGRTSGSTASRGTTQTP